MMKVVAALVMAVMLTALPLSLLLLGLYSLALVFPDSWGWFGGRTVGDHWPHTILPALQSIVPTVIVTSGAVIVAMSVGYRHTFGVGIATLILSACAYCATNYFLARTSDDELARSFSGLWIINLVIGLAILVPSYLAAYPVFRRVWRSRPVR
jgi:hypothetical protein